MSQDRRTSFVVRVAQGGCGQVSGVIERVATGAKEVFTGMEAIGRVIVRMLQREDAPAGSDSGTPPLRDEEPRPPSGGRS